MLYAYIHDMYVCTCTHILYIKNNILCTTCEASCTHVPGKMHRTKVHVNNTITTQHVVPHVRFQISFPFPVILCYLSVKTHTEYFQGLWGDRNTANFDD
jgi:hypothetical protein